jgi:hypothetical protein
MFLNFIEVFFNFFRNIMAKLILEQPVSVQRYKINLNHLDNKFYKYFIEYFSTVDEESRDSPSAESSQRASQLC